MIHSNSKRQRGAVLFISLMVLVMMMIAGIGLVRSVWSGTLAVGNIGFRQGALASSDIGMQKATALLYALSTTDGDSASSCYSSTKLGHDSRGVPSAMLNKATFDANATYSANCVLTKANNSAVPDGETIRFIIDRQCSSSTFSVTDCSVYVSPNACSATNAGGNSECIVGKQALFRVTVRVDGPRNTVSYAQAMVTRPTSS